MPNEKIIITETRKPQTQAQIDAKRRRNTAKMMRRKLNKVNKARNSNQSEVIRNTVVKVLGPQVSNASQADQKAMLDNIAQLLEGILLQKFPYALPRPCGAYVAPHQYSWTKTIVLDTVPKLKGAFLVTNDPEGILHLGELDAEDQIVPAETTLITEPGKQCTYPAVGTVCLDYDIKMLSGKTYKTSTSSQAGFQHWSNSNSKFTPGFKYYPGVITGDPKPVLRFNNAGAKAGSFSYQAGYVDKLGQAVMDINHNVAMIADLNSYDLSVDAGYAAWLGHIIDPAISKGFWFAFAFTFSGSSYEPSSNNIGITFQSNLELVTPFTWTIHSLFQLMDVGDVAELQFLKADRYNVTGNHVVFTNNSSYFLKGGNIFGARLPGNSFGSLPGTPDALQALISTQVHHKMVCSSLETGLSYSFTPEKLQDWLFERNYNADPYSGNPENIPYLAAAYDASAASIAQGFPAFVFTGKVSIEYLTTDPSNFFCSTPACGPIFDAILNSLAKENCVSENPDHIANIKRVIKSVLTTDNVKYAVKSLISAGIKVAPFALALL